MNFNTDYKVTDEMLEKARVISDEQVEKELNKDEESAFFTINPYEIIRNATLKPNAKLVYATILTLSRKYGVCWATNEWLGKTHNLTSVAMSRLVNQLIETGFIVAKYRQIKFDVRKRFLFIDYSKIQSYVKMVKKMEEEKKLAKQGIKIEKESKPLKKHLSNVINKVKKEVYTENPNTKPILTEQSNSEIISENKNISNEKTVNDVTNIEKHNFSKNNKPKTEINTLSESQDFTKNVNQFNKSVVGNLTKNVHRIIQVYNNIPCQTTFLSQSYSPTVSDVLNSFPNVKEFKTSFQNQNFERSQKTQNETKMLNTTSHNSKKSKSTSSFSKTHFKKTDYDECREILFKNRDILKSQNKFVDETPYPFAIINNWLKSCFVNYGVEKTKQGIKNSTKNDWLVNTAQYKFNALFSKKVFPSLLSNTQNYSQSNTHHVIDFHNQNWDLAF